MTKRTLFASLAGLVAVGLGVSTIANAALHFVPGAKCVVRSGPAAAYDANGQIANPGTSFQTVICPGDTLDLATNVTSKISVTDNSTAEQVCCSTRTRNANNGTMNAGSNECTSVANTGADIFIVPPDVGPVGGTFNYHWVQCSVPPISASGARSSVNAYRINDI
jgi:hypothetical protein